MLSPGAFVRRARLLSLLLPALAGEARAAEAPATVALVLDTSGSLSQADLALAGELATGVLELLPPGSEAAVFSFDDQSRLVQPRTTDADAVRGAIDGLHTAGRYTALHDALFDASRYLHDDAGGRRAILLVTDGKDERSALDLEDGLKLAQDARIPVFCVGVGRVEERVLRRIAKLTGGDYFPSGEARASEIAERIRAAPEARVAAEEAPAPPPPTPAASPASDPTASTRPVSWSPLLLAGAGLVLLLAAAAVALLGRRPRHPATGSSPGPSGPVRLDTAHEEALSGTVLARMDVSGEAVERTVLLVEKPFLVVTRGPRKGESFPLSEESAISIGRARANDVALEDTSVSAQHCRIRPDRGRFVLHDLQSTNGTMVNGRRVDRHVLDEGDVIQIGETSLQFRRDRRG